MNQDGFPRRCSGTSAVIVMIIMAMLVRRRQRCRQRRLRSAAREQVARSGDEPLIVHGQRGDDERHALDEARGDARRREQTRDQDRNGSGEGLEDVVGVLRTSRAKGGGWGRVGHGGAE